MIGINVLVVSWPEKDYVITNFLDKCGPYFGHNDSPVLSLLYWEFNYTRQEVTRFDQ